MKNGMLLCPPLNEEDDDYPEEMLCSITQEYPPGLLVILNGNVHFRVDLYHPSFFDKETREFKLKIHPLERTPITSIEPLPVDPIDPGCSPCSRLIFSIYAIIAARKSAYTDS